MHFKKRVKYEGKACLVLKECALIPTRKINLSFQEHRLPKHWARIQNTGASNACSHLFPVQKTLSSLVPHLIFF